MDGPTAGNKGHRSAQIMVDLCRIRLSFLEPNRFRGKLLDGVFLLGPYPSAWPRSEQTHLAKFPKRIICSQDSRTLWERQVTSELIGSLACAEWRRSRQGRGGFGGGGYRKNSGGRSADPLVLLIVQRGWATCLKIDKKSANQSWLILTTWVAWLLFWEKLTPAHAQCGWLEPQMDLLESCGVEGASSLIEGR